MYFTVKYVLCKDIIIKYTVSDKFKRRRYNAENVVKNDVKARGSGKKAGRDTPSEPDLDNTSVGKLRRHTDKPYS